MKQYKVSINFTFENEDCDVVQEYDDEGEPIPLNQYEQAELDAFERTDRYFEKHSLVKYIRKNDPMHLVENLFHNAEVISAEWDKKKFRIHMVVDSYMSEEELIEDLRSTPLEDTEYEALSETGWIIMTRGLKGEQFDPSWDTKDFWIYGLLDFRKNHMRVKEIGEKVEVPGYDKIFSITEKGKEVYQKMAALKLEGIQFSEEDEIKFQAMKILMKDKRIYPVGKVLSKI